MNDNTNTNDESEQETQETVNAVISGLEELLAAMSGHEGEENEALTEAPEEVLARITMQARHPNVYEAYSNVGPGFTGRLCMMALSGSLPNHVHFLQDGDSSDEAPEGMVLGVIENKEDDSFQCFMMLHHKNTEVENPRGVRVTDQKFATIEEAVAFNNAKIKHYASLSGTDPEIRSFAASMVTGERREITDEKGDWT